MVESIRGTLRSIDVSSSQISSTVKNMSIQFDGVLGSLNSLKNISYLNTGISLANLAVDVAGFMVISDKLSEIGDRLKSIDSNTVKLLGIAKNDLIEEYRNYFMSANHIYDIIKHNEQTDLEKLCEMLIRLNSFISNLIDHTIDSTFSSEMISEMIFTLMPAYTFLLNEYLKLHYYQKHRKDENYNAFLSLYDKLTAPVIIEKMFDYLALDCKMSIMDAADAVNVQMLFAINNKVQIEDSMCLLEIFDTEEKLSEFDRELEVIMKKDIQKSIPRIADECEIKADECRKMIDDFFD